jgi:hypothetical protein
VAFLVCVLPVTTTATPAPAGRGVSAGLEKTTTTLSVPVMVFDMLVPLVPELNLLN